MRASPNQASDDVVTMPMLIKEVAHETGVNQRVAGNIIRTTFGVIRTMMNNNAAVRVHNFGTFYTRVRNGYFMNFTKNGGKINNNLKGPVYVKSTYLPSVKFSKTFKGQLKKKEVKETCTQDSTSDLQQQQL